MKRRYRVQVACLLPFCLGQGCFMTSVNGYACVNCAAEALAKRQVDPRKSAVEVQSDLRSEHERRQPALGVNAPQASAATGSRLNLYA